MKPTRTERAIALVARLLIDGAKLICRMFGHAAPTWLGKSEPRIKVCSRCGGML